MTNLQIAGWHHSHLAREAETARYFGITIERVRAALAANKAAQDAASGWHARPARIVS